MKERDMSDSITCRPAADVAAAPQGQTMFQPASNEGLLAQVRAFGRVARGAAATCLRGKDAEKELEDRKNVHGQ
jgi:hypothetical protein